MGDGCQSADSISLLWWLLCGPGRARCDVGEPGAASPWLLHGLGTPSVFLEMLLWGWAQKDVIAIVKPGELHGFWIQVSQAALGMLCWTFSLVLNGLWLRRAWRTVPSAQLIARVRVYSRSGKKGHMEKDSWWIPRKKSHGKPPNYQGLIASELTARSLVLRSCGINARLR